MLEKPYYKMIRDIETDVETKRLAEIEASVTTVSLNDCRYSHMASIESRRSKSLKSKRVFGRIDIDPRNSWIFSVMRFVPLFPSLVTLTDLSDSVCIERRCCGSRNGINASLRGTRRVRLRRKRSESDVRSERERVPSVLLLRETKNE